MGPLDSFLSVIVDKAPWVVDVFAWLSILAVLFLVWLILGFPTLLIERFIRGKREDYRQFLEGMASASDVYRRRNDELAAQHLKEFLDGRRHHALADLAFSFWNNPIRKAARAAIKIERRYSKSIRTIAKGLRAALEKFNGACRKVEKLKIEFPDIAKDIPDPGKIKATHDTESRIMRARRDWFIYTFLLSALLLINTLMLSQILKGLEERWPHVFGQHVPFLKWSLAVVCYAALSRVGRLSTYTPFGVCPSSARCGRVWL